MDPGPWLAAHQPPQQPGLQGGQGTQGTQGSQGTQGTQGPQGHQGVKRTQGVLGVQASTISRDHLGPLVNLGRWSLASFPADGTLKLLLETFCPAVSLGSPAHLLAEGPEDGLGGPGGHHRPALGGSALVCISTHAMVVMISVSY